MFPAGKKASVAASTLFLSPVVKRNAVAVVVVVLAVVVVVVVVVAVVVLAVLVAVAVCHLAAAESGEEI